MKIVRKKRNCTTAGDALHELEEVLKELRNKCPWDKEQTFSSLRRFTIEELYELLEAIDKRDMPNVREELGDLLTHVVFYTNLAEEANAFTLQEVLERNTEKLIHRHPHIYGDGSIQLGDSQSVEKNWEKLKGKEKKSMFSGLPAGMPPIVKAEKLQDKVARSGFVWKGRNSTKHNFEEERNELAQAAQTGNQSAIEKEFGDTFFALINYAHHLGVDASVALEKANQKFKQRVERIEQRLEEKGKRFHEATTEELQRLWKTGKEDVG